MTPETQHKIAGNVKAWWFGYWMTTFSLFIFTVACIRGCVSVVSRPDNVATIKHYLFISTPELIEEMNNRDGKQ